jgi:hypothetical protein
MTWTIEESDMHSQGRKPGVNSDVVAAIAITLLAHAVLLSWLLRPATLEERPFVRRGISASHRLQLRLLAPRRASHAQQVSKSVGKTAARHLDRTHHRPASSSLRASVSDERSRSPTTTVAAVPSVSLFDTNGSIRMSREAPRLRAADAVDMRHFQQLPCRGTRFSDHWTRGQDETLGAEIARKYLLVIGLYNGQTEAAYQKRRAYLDQACPH